jgi:RNA polymerase sigma factor (sigma-70 family)
MAKIVAPPDIEKSFSKPGREWTSGEKTRVKTWLNEDPQLYYLLVFALHHLGAGAQSADAEDVWQDFCETRLSRIMNNYDHEKGRRFWNWLLFCFERYCHDGGEQNRKRRKSEIPLIQETKDGELLVLEIVDEHPDSNPEEQFAQKEKWRIVQECLRSLPEGHYTVVVRFYFEGLSVKAIALILQISEALVKVRLFRARRRVAQCLAQHLGG